MPQMETGIASGAIQHDFFDVEIDLDVADARHATNIMAALRANPFVDEVERARG